MSMTLQQLTQYVGNNVQKTDTNSLNTFQGYIQKNYLMIWEKYTWIESKTSVTQSLSAGTNSLLVDSNIELVSMVIWDTYPLRNSDLENLYRWRPDWPTQTGTPSFYVNMPKQSGQCFIMFDTSPTTTFNVTIVGKMKFTQLVNSTDTPLLRGIDNALIAFST